ncbi:hypothetical protein ACHAWO_010704 [Cyclotella atomus]|uniref:SUN domain-containing protein n=1 Tax=Cyclotella atomus TaxID=382360 RepID=A0ABD3PIM2_9STRA
MPNSTKKNGSSTKEDEDAASPQANISPPGMAMRSGRKKTRSSKAADDDDESVDSASVASRSSRASRASASSRASRASRRSSTSALDTGNSATRASRRKRKSDGHESDIPSEVKSKRRRKKELEVVNEDVEMEDEAVGADGKKASADTEDDHVSDLEMEEKDVTDEKKDDDDVNMEEKESSNEHSQSAEDKGKNGDAVQMAPPEVQSVATKNAAAKSTKPSSPPVGSTTLQRLAQGLRLPSQHTPKPPPTVNVEGTTPAPPGGRRLFFETAKKKGNKLRLSLSTQVANSAEGQVEEEVHSPPNMERTPLQFESRLTKRDVISYFTMWTVVLLSLFIVINMTAILNRDAKVLNFFSRWNVRHNADRLSQPDYTVVDTVSEPQVIENVVQVVDPTLLSETKKKMQVQRREEYELNNVNSAIEQARMDLDVMTDLMKQLLADYPILESDRFDPSLLDADANDINSQLKSLQKSTAAKQSLLPAWEHALNTAEKSMHDFIDGKIDQAEINSALDKLSQSSLIGAPARILDETKIVLPGESCKGKNYIHTAMENLQTDEKIDVVGGIDIEALDNASDAPVRSEDAHAAYGSLMKYAQATVASLFGQGPSVQVQNWVRHVIDDQWAKNGLNKPVDSVIEPLVAPKNSAPSGDGSSYTKIDALNDIDRLLEIESADRTGMFDHATVIHGARVLYRGFYATSPSLYQSLPLLNRLLAYAKLRFYGHPPEVALLPSSTYGRGQCWSFTEEKRRSSNGEIRGEYATLTVKLNSPTFVTEVVVEHFLSGDMTSAIREFRVLGFEDGGAFGEPLELGSFQFDTAGKFGLQRFSIPSSVNGAGVPKLKAISLAVDSNWGADFTCLYRFRVHGL